MRAPAGAVRDGPVADYFEVGFGIGTSLRPPAKVPHHPPLLSAKT